MTADIHIVTKKPEIIQKQKDNETQKQTTTLMLNKHEIIVVSFCAHRGGGTRKSEYDNCKVASNY